MGITSEGMSVADMAAVLGNNDGFGNGNGAWWLLILLIFANNGWGNNWGGNGNGGALMGYATQQDVQSGFDQAAVMTGLNGINTTLSNGFSNAEISRAATLANLTNQMNNIAMAQQNCCCENRAATADLKYTVSQEACADRQAVTSALYDVTTANNANTQALLNAINGGIQSIQDKLCQQEIDALKTQNANLQTQLNLANLRGSQDAQTAAILAGQAANAQAIEQYLAPVPKPAYIVQNPNCCGNYYTTNCGCNA